MGMIYLVRKKLFQTKEGAKQLYYAVQRTLQPRGGVTEDILAKRIAHRTGRSEGDVKGILADLPHFIEEALKNGGVGIHQRTGFFPYCDNQRGL